MSEEMGFTRDTIKSMSVEDLKRIVKDPIKMEAYNAFLRTREGVQAVAEIMGDPHMSGIESQPVVADELSPTEVVNNPAVAEFNQAEEDAKAAAQAAATAAAAQAAQVEADRQAAAAQAAQLEASRKAEQEAYAEAGIRVIYDQSGNIQKIVKDYQVVDDKTGQPIGRPTHLEARSWVELSRKEQEAHSQATRAFQRLKDQKTTFKRQEVAAPKFMSDAETAQAAEDLKSDNEVKALAADRKLRADQILRDQQKAAIDRENNHQKEVALEWMTKHIGDYNRCQANGKILADYLEANNLEWSVDNLDLAFAATESQLAPYEAPVAAVPAPKVVDNPPAVVPQEPAPIAAPVIQPVPVVATETPTPPVPVPNAQPPARRPGVNAGGLEPGQSSAPRPSSRPAGLTMKDIKGWSLEQMKKERNNPARRAEIDRTIAAYNKARTTRV